MRQQNQELTHVKHEFDPIFDENSEILILGTLPSVKSREQNFYYGHPQNRFWKVIAALFCEPVPEGIPEKKDLLLKHHAVNITGDAVCTTIVAKQQGAFNENTFRADN